MRVQTEEWRRFIPGVRIYKGKKTLFYNGEILYEGDAFGRPILFDGRPLVYDKEERNSWQVIIVLSGVEIIPLCTFKYCNNLETVIMADTVKRIEYGTFFHCYSIQLVKLSRNLEYIGAWAFWSCSSLTSIFIPPSCQEIEERAFIACTSLLILSIPQTVEVGEGVFQYTALIMRAPFEFDEDGYYDRNDEEAVIQWVKSINIEEEYDLHRACTSFNPLTEIIHALVKRKGTKAMKMPNAIGITPSQYLVENPFADISEREILNRYILDMMGEVF